MSFSEFTLEAIRTYVEHWNYVHGLHESFGAWDQQPHPELHDGVDHYIRKTRKGRN
ncbi:hypothetical protein CCP3SC1_2430002 [Gammaproteobacteria bacterium]